MLVMVSKILEKIISTRYFNKALRWYLEARNLEHLVYKVLMTDDISKLEDYECKWWDKNIIIQYALKKQENFLDILYPETFNKIKTRFK